ncbi:MAG: hypothetical protein ACQESR_06200 [Planctomycetota bacterium]
MSIVSLVAVHGCRYTAWTRKARMDATAPHGCHGSAWMPRLRMDATAPHGCHGPAWMPRLRMDATAPHGCHGLVPWWFTFAATNRPDTPLLAVGSVERNGPRDKPVAHPAKPFFKMCNGSANVRGYWSLGRERLRKAEGQMGLLILAEVMTYGAAAAAQPRARNCRRVGESLL